MNDTNAQASEKGSNGLPYYKQVHWGSVTFLNAEWPEYIDNAADFAEKQM